jgi:hypothetical protein
VADRVVGQGNVGQAAYNFVAYRVNYQGSLFGSRIGEAGNIDPVEVGVIDHGMLQITG